MKKIIKKLVDDFYTISPKYRTKKMLKQILIKGLCDKSKKVIIYAGVGSTTWDTDANSLAKALEEEGYKIVDIIPVNGLDSPKIEYLK